MLRVLCILCFICLDSPSQSCQGTGWCRPSLLSQFAVVEGCSKRGGNHRELEPVPKNNKQEGRKACATNSIKHGETRHHKFSAWAIRGRKMMHPTPQVMWQSEVHGFIRTVNCMMINVSTGQITTRIELSILSELRLPYSCLVLLKLL